MATAQALVDDVRSRVVEASADFFTDAEILRWLNQGYKRFISLTEWAERCVAYRMIANQFQYALGSDTIKVSDVRWQDKYKVWMKDQEEFHHIAGAAAGTTSSRPYMYKLFPWDGYIRIHPKPSASSASTTLNGAVSSTSATTITVVSTSSFPSYGRIIIDSEQILYTGTTSTTFTGCVRGDGTTTAATHTDTTAVYAAPLEVYQVYQPADLAIGTVGTVTSPTYDEAIINYACHVAMLKREKYDTAQLFRKLFDDIVSTAVAERRKMQLDRLFAIKDEDNFGDMLYY